MPDIFSTHVQQKEDRQNEKKLNTDSAGYMQGDNGNWQEANNEELEDVANDILQKYRKSFEEIAK